MSECECKWDMRKQGEAECMVHLYTVWHLPRQQIDPTSKAGNTLEHTQVRTTSHRTKLPRHASVGSTNDLRRTLWTFSCAVRTQSNRCQSIKESIILCVLSVGSFLPFLLPRQRTGVFYVTLNKNLLSSSHIGLAMHMPHAHIFTIISGLIPHQTASHLCVLKCFPGLNISYANSLWSTDSLQIAFSCSPNNRRTAECCLPRLGNTSTSLFSLASFVFAFCWHSDVNPALQYLRNFNYFYELMNLAVHIASCGPWVGLVGNRWVTCGLHVTYGSQMGHSWIRGWVVHDL